MTPKQLALLALLAFGLACGRSGKMNRNQDNYDVVNEGTATGVTSTINAPGETPPPLTATNVDTTTAFTLPQMETATTGTVPPGTIAGSLPTTTAPIYSNNTPPPRPRPRPAPTPQPVTPEPQPTQPAPQPAPQPPTDTATPPPPTDTSATATDTTGTAEKKKPVPPTATAPPPPPTTSAPTTTDTTGTQG